MVNKAKRIITRYISLILVIGITLPLFGDLTINVSAKKERCCLRSEIMVY